MIPWLSKETPFPPVERALRTPNGLLAAGDTLSATRLLEAYRQGIFPWFSTGEPILWWSPDPRMVLVPSEFKTSRSLAKLLRTPARQSQTALPEGSQEALSSSPIKLNGNYEVRTDSAFEAVMRACAAPRDGRHGGCDTLLAEPADCGSSRPAALPEPEGSASPCQGSTWISEGMIKAYCELHQLGQAHSVEVWVEGGLVGGLYGVSIGRMFYGESMFSRASNASKVALAHLARQLERWQYGMIDCQMNTPHLVTLGAREVPRSEFIARLQELVHYAQTDESISSGHPTYWKFDSDLFI